MTVPTPQAELEARMATLEHQLTDVVSDVREELRCFDTRLQRAERGVAHAPRAGEETAPARKPLAVSMPSPSARQSPAGRVSATLVSGISLADLLGGRVLAWLGGAAMLLGIVLFLALAVSHGWIDEQARVLLAGVASTALMAAGIWLHARRGGTRPAVAMVGAATAALFATLIVASDVYRLLASTPALVGALLVGALATVLAIRWAGRAIGGLGLLGALLAGVMVGAPIDALTIAILALSAACAMSVVVWQRWGWLAVGTIMISAPQWVDWLAQGQTAPVDALVLAAFAALGLLGGVGMQLRCTDRRLMRWAVAVVFSSGCTVALVGRIDLAEAASPALGDLWLAMLAGAHVGVGLWGARGARVSVPLRGLLIAIGVTLADVAFALYAHGPTLALGWSLTAVGFAWLARRSARQQAGESSREQTLGGLYNAGVAAHMALVLVRAIVEAPPSELVGGHVQLVAMVSVSAVAVSSVLCGCVLAPARSVRRQWWLIGAGAVVLYIASLWTVAAFQSTSAKASATLLELGVHQQAQVALSTLWGLVGLAALITGLRTSSAPLRTAGLSLLLVAVSKVFLFDLSTLTSVYRVVSFVVLGVLLLAGAFAYQRLRPAPHADAGAAGPGRGVSAPGPGS
jgi:uncharacterized membrane protein